MPTIDWLLILEKLGWPSAIVLGFGWIFVKYLWPFIVKQVEDFKKERTEERNQFISTINKIADQHQDVINKRAVERESFLEAIRVHENQFIGTTNEMIEVIRDLRAAIEVQDSKISRVIRHIEAPRKR